MRWLLIILTVLFVGLQFRLWVGEGSLAHKAELTKKVEQQRQINQQLQSRNQQVAQEVESLKTNLDSIEEKARKDLGMIKEGEIFYLVIDKDERIMPSSQDTEADQP
ncbi:cell division protein FtsB [SAR92 clade bacterium H921]|jgi:cell division protein FtsB|nr:cell division protein FtsB [SAR92 clade bacterium H921]MDG0971536.1 cell division protein FtsB [Porticoccaceae bacterium]MDG1308279.1 cell division protein FtsB [Porticoccaceae bacterium]